MWRVADVQGASNTEKKGFDNINVCWLRIEYIDLENHSVNTRERKEIG